MTKITSSKSLTSIVSDSPNDCELTPDFPPSPCLASSSIVGYPAPTVFARAPGPQQNVSNGNLAGLLEDSQPESSSPDASPPYEDFRIPEKGAHCSSDNIHEGEVYTNQIGQPVFPPVENCSKNTDESSPQEVPIVEKGVSEESKAWVNSFIQFSKAWGDAKAKRDAENSDNKHHGTDDPNDENSYPIIEPSVTDKKFENLIPSNDSSDGGDWFMDPDYVKPPRSNRHAEFYDVPLEDPVKRDTNNDSKKKENIEKAKEKDNYILSYLIENNIRRHKVDTRPSSNTQEEKNPGEANEIPQVEPRNNSITDTKSENESNLAADTLNNGNIPLIANPLHVNELIKCSMGINILNVIRLLMQSYENAFDINLEAPLKKELQLMKNKYGSVAGKVLFPEEYKSGKLALGAFSASSSSRPITREFYIRLKKGLAAETVKFKPPIDIIKYLKVLDEVQPDNNNNVTESGNGENDTANSDSSNWRDDIPEHMSQGQILPNVNKIPDSDTIGLEPMAEAGPSIHSYDDIFTLDQQCDDIGMDFILNPNKDPGQDAIDFSESLTRAMLDIDKVVGDLEAYCQGGE